MEIFFGAVIGLVCMLFLIFVLKDIRDHEKSDSKEISTLIKPKKSKKKGR
jgi:hypothetical protein